MCCQGGVKSASPPVGPPVDFDCDCEQLAELISRARGEVSKGLFSLILAEAAVLMRCGRGRRGLHLHQLGAKEHTQPRLTSKSTMPRMPG